MRACGYGVMDKKSYLVFGMNADGGIFNLATFPSSTIYLTRLWSKVSRWLTFDQSLDDIWAVLSAGLRQIGYTSIGIHNIFLLRLFG